MTVKCVICKADLIKGTNYCNQCESFQGPPCRVCGAPLIAEKSSWCNNCGKPQSRFIRAINFISISSMISIIPLLVVFTAYVSEKTEPEKSNIEVATVSCTPDGISFFARNTGNRPALLVDKANYRVQASSGEVGKGSLVYPAVSDGHLLAPDEGLLFRLDPVKIGNLPGKISPMPTDDALCLVKLDIKTIEFEGVEETRTFTCACAE